jgi:hypothetical protein
LFQVVRRSCAGGDVPLLIDQGAGVKTGETARAIRAALKRNPEVQQASYPITVRGDDVVHLESDVEDIITKRKAVRLARLVAGLPPVIEDRLCVVTSGQVTSDALQGRCSMRSGARVRSETWRSTPIKRRRPVVTKIGSKSEFRFAEFA